MLQEIRWGGKGIIEKKRLQTIIFRKHKIRATVSSIYCGKKAKRKYLGI